jgi:hypothetical protein
MGDFRDPEKGGFCKGNATAIAPPTVNTSLRDPEKVYSSSSPTHSSHSSSSDSTHSNPLSPLEPALTPDLFTDAELLSHQEITYTRTGASIATNGSRPPSFEIDFATDDPDDPRNWPLWYRSIIIACVSYGTWTVVLYSTSYTSSMPGMMKEFHIESEPVATLGVTVYLVGLAVGSLILAPLSEIYGRRPVYAGSLLFFCLMVLPCALATSLSEVLVARFFG